MEKIAAPGILAYRAGDCFANLVSLMSVMPAGRDIMSTTVEEVLQEYVVHFACSLTFKFADPDLGTRYCYNTLQSSSLHSKVMFSRPAEFLGVIRKSEH